MAATPKGWLSKEAGLCPAMHGRAPLRGALISLTDGAGEAAHTMHACGPTKQVKNGATALNQELNACQTSCLTQGARRWAEGLDPARPVWGRPGPTGAVQFVKNAGRVNATAPEGPCGLDTAPQRPADLKVIASRNRLICNV